MATPLPLRATSRRKARRRGREQSFVNFLSFGVQSTGCVACFFIAYAFVLICLTPMLSTHSTPSLKGAGPLEGAYIPHAPGQERLAEAASAVRAKLLKIRKGHGVTDASLLESAKAEFELLRARKKAQAEAKDVNVDISNEVERGVEGPTAKSGFVVLGMHRSGTSLLSGLLVTGAGYNVGGPLIGEAFDNEKGFFERIDVVLQNDEFMTAQQVWWASNVINYDSDKALEDKQSGKISFKEGKKGLQFLNDPSNAPWLQKDPRMCITLPTWLKLLNKEPAVVFTYRHPLEVALSLQKREKNFTLEHGLRLWVVYNMRAIQNSAGLCRVLSSNEAILENPLKEIQRISDDLTNKCGVLSPPRKLEQEDVDKFVDEGLQHNKKKRQEEESTHRILEEHDGCVVRDYDSQFTEGTPNRKRETNMYKIAMKIYCDFRSGKAYEKGYEWPDLH